MTEAVPIISLYNPPAVAEKRGHKYSAQTVQKKVTSTVYVQITNAIGLVRVKQLKKNVNDANWETCTERKGACPIMGVEVQHDGAAEQPKILTHNTCEYENPFSPLFLKITISSNMRNQLVANGLFCFELQIRDITTRTASFWCEQRGYQGNERGRTQPKQEHSQEITYPQQYVQVAEQPFQQCQPIGLPTFTFNQNVQDVEMQNQFISDPTDFFESLSTYLNDKVFPPRPEVEEREAKYIRRDVDNLIRKLQSCNIMAPPELYQEAYLKEQLQHDKEFLKIKIVLSNKNDTICFAIRVGSVTIAWNTNSLCSIDDDYKESVVFAGDMAMVTDKGSQMTVKYFLDDLARLMQDWNLECTYNAKSCNDYDFVKECQKVIAKYAQVKLPGSIEDYIRISSKQSRCLKCVVISADMQTAIGEEKLEELEFEKLTNTVAFQNHEDLDKFVYCLRKKVPNEEARKSLEDVLKGLDRGFWMRGDHTGKCPWGNPSTNPETNWGQSKRVPKNRQLQ
jgi:hypothetical protein